MRRLLAVPALCLAGGLATTSAASAASYTVFRSPSGNIVCGLDTLVVRCDIRSHDFADPPKPAGCDGDIGNAFKIDRGSPRGRAICAGDAAPSGGRVLRYGATIRRGTLRCTSSAAGMRCRNARSHGFFLSRGRFELF